MKKSVWIGLQNKERSVTLHGSLLSVWAGCVCCLLNHGNNPVSPPSLCRGSQCLLSINWNVRGLTKTTSNECQQLLQVASDHAAATAALTATPTALQCSTVCRQCENMKHNQYVLGLHICTALCTDYEHYALTMHMHTFHKLCLTADLAVPHHR